MPNPPASHASSMNPLRTSSPRRMATWLLRDFEQQSPNPIARPRVRYHYGATPDALRAQTPRTPAEPVFQRAQSPRRTTRPTSVPSGINRFNGHQWLIATPVCEKGLTRETNLAGSNLVRHSMSVLNPLLGYRPGAAPLSPNLITVCIQPGKTLRFASNPRANLRFQAIGHASEQW